MGGSCSDPVKGISSNIARSKLHGEARSQAEVWCESPLVGLVMYASVSDSRILVPEDSSFPLNKEWDRW